MGVLKLLPVAPYPKTLRRRRLSQRNPSRPSAQARKAPPMRMLSIASIIQALARVCARFLLLRWLHLPQNLMTDVPPGFHHDGPFDACAPSRNRNITKAPMAAWSAQTRQAIEEDFKTSKESPHYEPPKKKVDAMAHAWGILESEPFEDFSAGGGQSNDSRFHYPSHPHKSDEAPRRREAAPRRTALPPPQPIFVPGADAEFVPPSEPSPPLSPGTGAGMKRSKSLLHRFRKFRENPNMPVGNGDGDDVQTTYESGGTGRPNHKSQNSFAGRLAGGGVKEQLPSPPEEDTYVPDEATKNKNLPRLPKTNSASSGETGYFEQQTGADQSPATGLGRRRSLMQRVGGVVRGRK